MGSVNAGALPGSLAEITRKCKLRGRLSGRPKSNKEQSFWYNKLYLKLFSQLPPTGTCCLERRKLGSKIDSILHK